MTVSVSKSDIFTIVHYLQANLLTSFSPSAIWITEIVNNISGNFIACFVQRCNPFWSETNWKFIKIVPTLFSVPPA